MVISIIQPCFIPWLGYFEQIAMADIFVYMDDVQYTKKDWRNNNQLKSPYGLKKVSFPVKKVSRGTLIKDIEISYNSPWEENFLNQLMNWYGKAPYYDEVYELVSQEINKKHIMLTELNLNLNQAILDYLGIDTKIYFSSAIERKEENKADRVLEICSHFEGVNLLYDGKKAQDFLNENSFSEQGIDIVFQDYEHKPYPQLWGDFLPYMSIIDLLMNCGKDSLNYIVTSKKLS